MLIEKMVFSFSVVWLSVALAQKPPTQAAEATQSKTGTYSNLKLKMYRGKLTEANCAGGASNASAKPASKKAQGEASRSADKDAGTCLSTGATEFALKTKDGRTLAFDPVGNMRAQAAIKNRKSWEKAASSGKAVDVRVSGAEEGSNLTVLSIEPPPPR